MRVVLPMGLQGKGKNVDWETWSHLGVPKFSTNVEKGTGRTQMGQFLGYFLFRFWSQIDDFGGQGRPCTGLGQGLEIGVQKDAIYIGKLINLGANFDPSRLFPRVYFSVHFQVPSVSNLFATLVAKGIPKGGFWGAILKQFRGWGQKWKWSSRVDGSFILTFATNLEIASKWLPKNLLLDTKVHKVWNLRSSKKMMKNDASQINEYLDKWLPNGLPLSRRMGFFWTPTSTPCPKPVQGRPWPPKSSIFHQHLIKKSPKN